MTTTSTTVSLEITTKANSEQDSLNLTEKQDWKEINTMEVPEKHTTNIYQIQNSTLTNTNYSIPSNKIDQITNIKSKIESIFNLEDNNTNSPLQSHKIDIKITPNNRSDQLHDKTCIEIHIELKHNLTKRSNPWPRLMFLGEIQYDILNIYYYCSEIVREFGLDTYFENLDSNIIQELNKHNYSSTCKLTLKRFYDEQILTRLIRENEKRKQRNLGRLKQFNDSVTEFKINYART